MSLSEYPYSQLCGRSEGITEPWENEMRVVVLARKNVAAMKTGARHLLRSVGVLSPSTGTQFFPSAFANDPKTPK